MSIWLLEEDKKESLTELEIGLHYLILVDPVFGSGDSELVLDPFLVPLCYFNVLGTWFEIQIKHTSAITFEGFETFKQRYLNYYPNSVTLIGTRSKLSLFVCLLAKKPCMTSYHKYRWGKAIQIRFHEGKLHSSWKKCRC